MKKALKIALLCVLGVIVVVGVLVWVEFGSLIKGAMSCEKLDEGMYYMEYAGDDGFDELMKRGGCANINVQANYITDFLSKGPCQFRNKRGREDSRPTNKNLRTYPSFINITSFIIILMMKDRTIIVKSITL